LTFAAFAALFIERYSKAREKATADDAERFLKHLRDSGRAGSTCNHYRQLLKVLFKWARKKGCLQRDPMADAELPWLPQAKRNRHIDPAEERQLLANASPRMYRLIVGALETGCRLGELLKLQWSDIDFERRELRVRAENAKDGEDRILPVSSRLVAVLEMARLDPKGQPLGQEAYVFGDEVGQRIHSIASGWKVLVLKAHDVKTQRTRPEKDPQDTPEVHRKKRDRGRSLTKACRERLAKIDLRFHDLRHEADSRFVEAGWPIRHVKEMLGHASINTTDTYLNVTRLGLQESMRKYEDSRKVCTKLAQTTHEEGGAETTNGTPDFSEVPFGVALGNGGVDGTRTRGLRRDRPAF
jgi:integrase